MFDVRLIMAAMAAGLAACNAGGRGEPISGGPALAEIPGAHCIVDSPLRAIGAAEELIVDGQTLTFTHKPQAPGAVELPVANPGPHPEGACQRSELYQFGSGIYDTTGPIGGDPTGHADMIGHIVPPQVPNGIHTRLFSRAFAIASPCNGKRVVFVTNDQGMPSGLMRQEVLAAIAADEELSQYYGPDNVMLSSSHTHAGIGGFGEPTFLPELPAGAPQIVDDAYLILQGRINSPTYFDSDNFRIIVGGTVQAIRRAHANLQHNPEPAPIRLSIDELLNTNLNRSPLAYRQNSPTERGQYIDAKGQEIDVDRRFLQLNFVRDSGSPVGVLNWFGVHPTAIGNHNRLISSDTKGFASIGFEKLMGTVYQPDVGDQPNGQDNFVAAFAQTDEGDSVHTLFVFDADIAGSDAPGDGVPYRNRYGTNDPYDFDAPGFARGSRKAVEVFGTKQLAQALQQYSEGEVLSGPIDYRFFHVDMNAVTIDDPVILNGLEFPDLPQALYEDESKATCAGQAGMGLASGAPNGFGLIAGGYTCIDSAPADYFDEARNHYNGHFNGPGYGVIYQGDDPISVPIDGVLVSEVLAPLLCARAIIDASAACHKEKPVLAPYPAQLAPFQLFRVGNLAVLGLPWEITTMAARRIRQTVLDTLAPVGVDTVVIAGLSNAYLSYMTTREEYSAQMYEGASTIYGPWQLAAVRQESRRLALSLRNAETSPEGPTPSFEIGDLSPVTIDLPAEFGALLKDAEAQYQQGDTVEVSWQAGYPGNDPKIMSSYLFVERQIADTQWEVIATDLMPDLVFEWHWSQNPALTALHTVDSSTAGALWSIPGDTLPGLYRIRHEGVSRTSADDAPQPYVGYSREFEVTGTPTACP